MRLNAEIISVDGIGNRQIDEMFRLYSRYYEPACSSTFEKDLREKEWALVLRDECGRVRGFSTILTFDALVGSRARFLFSGDTIIEREFWGTQVLAFRWMEFAGSIKRRDPSTPLYWLLISKGHRTYRYLAAFARTFYPTYRAETPGHVQALMDAAAIAKFGDAYSARRGIVEHDKDSVHLIPELADSDKHRLNRDVQFFRERNPGHGDGDELVCLCELSAGNLTPIAQRQFLRGYGDRSMETVA
jgi:hypothetical protein